MTKRTKRWGTSEGRGKLKKKKGREEDLRS
jgi:hypothetical protein